jgi:hypothetical protein
MECSVSRLLVVVLGVRGLDWLLFTHVHVMGRAHCFSPLLTGVVFLRSAAYAGICFSRGRVAYISSPSVAYTLVLLGALCAVL